MSAMTRRFTANLLWLVIFSAGVISAAFLSFASGVVFDDSYTVTLEMPESGGLLTGQEVTVLGRALGVVSDVQITREGVLLELKVSGGESVPLEGRAQVLRRSPIGEQTIDLAPIGPNWTPAEPGDLLQPVERIVPAQVPFLLRASADFLGAVDPTSLGTIVHELAAGLGGRGDQLRQLGRDSLDLGETLVAGIPEFERLLDESEDLLGTLRDHRSSLAASFGNTAEFLDVLADNQTELEGLLESGDRMLVQADALVRNQRANLTCLSRDLNEVNEMLLGPTTAQGGQTERYETKLDELNMLLDKAPSFFDNFDIVLQHDAETGIAWARILLSLENAGGGAPYLESRATPATKPGAACETDEFGTGVNAVRQEFHQAPDVSSPGIDYAPLVAPQAGGQLDPPAGDAPLPATGGGALIGMTVLGLAGGSILRWRRP